MDRQRNIIFSILILIILSASGFFIVNQLGNQQSADDAAAGTCEDQNLVSCKNGCSAANGCYSYAQLSSYGGGCNKVYDAKCGGSDTKCAQNGSRPGSAGCCAGLTKCPNGRCGTSCVNPNQNPSEAECRNDSNCPTNERCSNSKCVRRTTTQPPAGCGNDDNKCPNTQWCSGTSCVGKRAGGGSCSRNRQCLNGQCGSDGKCVTNNDTTGPNTGAGGSGGSGSVGAGAACTPGAGQCGPGYACTVTNPNDPNTVCNAVNAEEVQCRDGGICGDILAFKCESHSDFEANGSCFKGKKEFSPGSFGEALNYIDGCGQVDTVCSSEDKLCGDFTIRKENCGGGSGGGGNPIVATVTRTCGSTCSATSQCPGNHTCSGGVCTKNICLSGTCGPNARCGTPLACGDSCNANGNCSAGHVCNGGTCVTAFCNANPGSCTDGECTPATCGNATIDAGESCDVGEEDACSTGSVCNTSTCQCDRTGCGDTCSADTDCPTDHTCGSGGTCELNFCNDNPGECGDDSCEVLPLETALPQTAIFGSTTDTVLFGALIMMIAVVSYKLGIWNQLSERLLANVDVDFSGFEKKKEYEDRLVD